MSMQRCYCLTNHHGPLEMREGPIPVPKDGEVLVKVTGAGVCHSDLHIWEGFYDLGGGKKISLKDRGVALPKTLGHEIAGEIVKAGPSATGAKIGASVVVFPWIGCGTCPVCKAGDENICLKARSLGVFHPDGSLADVPTFLLTAAAILKHNASISGAEVGCQAEVGSASAMAAAGLAAVLGGTPEQVENAAEIALEHHPGMTCDPVAGLVQVPCIERYAMGAVKAVTAPLLR